MGEIKIHTFLDKNGVYVPVPVLTQKLYYPLSPQTRDEVDFNAYVDRSLEELVSLSEKIDFSTGKDFAYNPKIYITEDYKGHTRGYYYEYLVFEADFPIDYPDRDYRMYGGNLPKEGEPLHYDERQSLVISSNMDSFAKDVQLFLLRTQLAKPGYLGTWKSEIVIGTKFIEQYYIHDSILHLHRIIPIKKSWPQLKELSILQVEEWFKKYNYSFLKFSQSKTERALNAFTYLFDDYTIIAHNLFWAMVAIETLYCNGSSELADQLNQKIQILLGKAEDLPKVIKKLYAFRSRFIHGDLDIPSFYHSSEGKDEDKYSSNLTENVTLAVAILTATLQELIARDISSLNFEYKLKG